MLVDAHQHFWRLADRVGEWPPAELEAIYRDFEPENLKPLLDACGIDGTVLVQTRESEADTAFMLDLAARHDFILGVVGWTDLKADDAREAVTRLSANPKLKGLRPMLQGLTDDAWITDPALDEPVAAMLSADLAFDALVYPRHLPHLIVFADRHPQLRIVIDHGAKPEIAQGKFVEWRAAMADLAQLPNVSCKLSGLLTEAGDQKREAVRPYAETILDLFGADGVMWGSDWPVVRLASEYQSWFDQCRALVPAEHHANVFGINALSFYRLNG